MKFIDTHAHPHMEGFGMPAEEFMSRARAAGLSGIICVGTGARDSGRAITFAAKYDICFSSVGLHPHEARLGRDELELLAPLARREKVVAIGECGLDYYYLHSPKNDQRKALIYQIELAVECNLPLIFHVRDGKEFERTAFDDLFAILEDYPKVRGVVHSFSSSRKNLERCLLRGLYIGVNGIATFSRDDEQLAAFEKVPLDSLVLETDAPFLTPVPYRGTINHSANVGVVAEFLANLRGEPVADIASASTNNAQELFKLWQNNT